MFSSNLSLVFIEKYILLSPSRLEKADRPSAKFLARIKV